MPNTELGFEAPVELSLLLPVPVAPLPKPFVEVPVPVESLPVLPLAFSIPNPPVTPLNPLELKTMPDEPEFVAPGDETVTVTVGDRLPPP